MKKYTVYHNPRCSKSRCAIQILDEMQAEYEVVEYLKKPLSADELRTILSQLKIPASELIRKSEPDYKENFKGKELDENQWIEAMVRFPKLIERPIVTRNGEAVVARPVERINDL
jgi:arsenate reductase